MSVDCGFTAASSASREKTSSTGTGIPVDCGFAASVCAGAKSASKEKISSVGCADGGLDFSVVGNVAASSEKNSTAFGEGEAARSAASIWPTVSLGKLRVVVAGTAVCDVEVTPKAGEGSVLATSAGTGSVSVSEIGRTGSTGEEVFVSAVAGISRGGITGVIFERGFEEAAGGNVAVVGV